MKLMKTGQGQTIKVDDIVFDWLSGWKWSITAGYASSRTKGEFVYMHRLLLNAPKGKHVDHINGDILDNRVRNLRVCEVKQNIRHRTVVNKNNTSGFPGVRALSNGKFQAYIKVNRKQINLGYFSDAVTASQKYKLARRIYFGEYA